MASYKVVRARSQQRPYYPHEENGAQKQNRKRASIEQLKPYLDKREQLSEEILHGKYIPQPIRGAAGLSGSIKKVKGEWIAESPMGSVKVAFVPKNELGVLDHDVTLPSGEVVRNPMRVMPNGQGSEVVFTLFQRAGMTDEMVEKDSQAVLSDLEKLKDLLETSSRVTNGF